MGHQWEDRDGFRYKTDGKVVALVARLPEGERQELLVAIDSGVAAREILRLAEENERHAAARRDPRSAQP